MHGPPPPTDAHCAQARQTRRRAQQQPLHFFGEGDEPPDRYVLGSGKLGQDGYYVLDRPSRAQSQ